MSNLVPLSTSSSIAKFTTADEGYQLHVADGDGERAFRARVNFDVPFQAAPVVYVGIAGFDIDHADTARLRVRAEEITPTGFDLVLTTWRSTRVYGADVSWLAIG